jgi:hypothetical protein
MLNELVGCLVLVLVVSLLDPFLWLMVAISTADREDRKNRDLHIWQRTGL